MEKIDYDLMALKNAKRIANEGDRLMTLTKLELKNAHKMSEDELALMADLRDVARRMIKTGNFFQKYVRNQMD